MAQLTGFLTGTSQSDLFDGSLEVVDLTEDTTEIGISGATIDALNGDDRIEGAVTLAPSIGELDLRATGITDTTINAGTGNDTVLGQGITFDMLPGLKAYPLGRSRRAALFV